MRLYFGVEQEVDYTNWKNHREVRKVVPHYVWFGRTEWHPVDGWLVRCYDVDKGALRDYSLNDIHGNVTFPK
jgi:hypothetical protein